MTSHQLKESREAFVKKQEWTVWEEEEEEWEREHAQKGEMGIAVLMAPQWLIMDKDRNNAIGRQKSRAVSWGLDGKVQAWQVWLSPAMRESLQSFWYWRKLATGCVSCICLIGVCSLWPWKAAGLKLCSSLEHETGTQATGWKMWSLMYLLPLVDIVRGSAGLLFLALFCSLLKATGSFVLHQRQVGDHSEG